MVSLPDCVNWLFRSFRIAHVMEYRACTQPNTTCSANIIAHRVALIITDAWLFERLSKKLRLAGVYQSDLLCARMLRSVCKYLYKTIGVIRNRIKPHDFFWCSILYSFKKQTLTQHG